MNNFNIFDWENYINRYNDLKVACVNTKEKAWNHWINHGQKEGRISNICYLDTDYKIFDWEQYVSNYMDLQQNGINIKEKAWNHWINYGKKEGRNFFKIQKTNLSKNNNVFLVIDCQPMQHEIRGIGRYCLNFVNTIIEKTDYSIKLLVNNFLPKQDLPNIHLRKGVEILIVDFLNVSYSNDICRNLNHNENDYIYEQQLANTINLINPLIYLNLSDFDRRKVMINLDLLNKNIITFSILYDLIPLKNNWLPSMPKKWSETYINQVENLKKYNKLLAISEFTKNDCDDILDNIVSISTGANVKNKTYTDDQINTTLNKFGINKKYIFCQTAFGPNKSLNLLVNQYNLLPDYIKDNVLLVLGVSGIPTEYINANNMTGPNIIITGYLNEDDLWILHEMSWLFVFPSSYEGFGLPPVEAMCHNKPVIVAKNTSLIEIMGDENFMFNNLNNSCVELICKLYNDENFYNECKTYCFDRKDLFTWDNTYDKFKILY
jgi:glycosyltransferase involved in cell wall biosynthesis